jgi:hypothetical protein
MRFPFVCPAISTHPFYCSRKVNLFELDLFSASITREDMAVAHGVVCHSLPYVYFRRFGMKSLSTAILVDPCDVVNNVVRSLKANTVHSGQFLYFNAVFSQSTYFKYKGRR